MAKGRLKGRTDSTLPIPCSENDDDDELWYFVIKIL